MNCLIMIEICAILFLLYKNVKKQLKPNKLDGLPNEFYKCFWDQLSVLKDFQSFLSYIKRVKKMFYKNYRPTSYTNTDYKMIALFFSQRLQDDTFSNRKWTNSLYLRPFYRYQCAFYFKYLWLLQQYNKQCFLLFLDFEKASD